jgi:hypothetical protein
MPILSMFYGVIVRMHNERGGRHNEPHLHAEYNGEEIAIQLDGTILAGGIDNKKLKLLLAWMVLHEDEIRAVWNMLQEGEGYFKIDPLK